MIHPYIPPSNQEAMIYQNTPNSYSNGVYTQNSARNNQMIVIKINEETRLQRAKLNYKHEEEQRQKTYYQVVMLDSYSIARRGRPYRRHNSLYCYCYDSDEDCIYNCETMCLFCCIFPPRSCFFLLYLIVKYICVYIWQWLSLCNDCCCHILERIGNGIGICCSAISDLCCDCFTPIENCCSSLCNDIFSRDKICGCWQFIWGCCSVGATFIANLFSGCIEYIMICLDFILNSCLSSIFTFLNSCLDMVLTVFLQMGQFICDNCCQVLCGLCDSLF